MIFPDEATRDRSRDRPHLESGQSRHGAADARVLATLAEAGRLAELAPRALSAIVHHAAIESLGVVERWACGDAIADIVRSVPEACTKDHLESLVDLLADEDERFVDEIVQAVAHLLSWDEPAPSASCRHILRSSVPRNGAGGRG